MTPAKRCVECNSEFYGPPFVNICWPCEVRRKNAAEESAAHSAAHSRLLDMVARFSPQPSTATIDELLTLIETNGAEVVVRMSAAEAEVARLRAEIDKRGNDRILVMREQKAALKWGGQ